MAEDPKKVDWLQENAWKIQPTSDYRRAEYEDRILYQAEAKSLAKQHERFRSLGLVKGYKAAPVNLGAGSGGGHNDLITNDWEQEILREWHHNFPEDASKIPDIGEQWWWNNIGKVTDGFVNYFSSSGHRPDFSDWMTDDLRKEISKYPVVQQNKFHTAISEEQLRDMMLSLKGYETTHKFLSEAFYSVSRKSWLEEHDVSDFGISSIQTGLAVGEWLAHMSDPVVLASYMASGGAASIVGRAAFTMKHGQMLARLAAVKGHVDVASRAFASAGLHAFADMGVATMYTNIAMDGRIDYAPEEAQSHIVGAAIFGSIMGGIQGVGRIGRIHPKTGEWVPGSGARGLNQQLDVLKADKMASTTQWLHDVGLEAEPIMHDFIRNPHNSTVRREIMRDVEMLANGQTPKTGRFIKGGRKSAGEALRFLKRLERLEVIEQEVWTAHAKKHYSRAQSIIKEYYDILKDTTDPTTSTFTEIVAATVLKTKNTNAARAILNTEGAGNLLSVEHIEYLLKYHPEELLAIDANRIATDLDMHGRPMVSAKHYDPMQPRGRKMREARPEPKSASGLHRIVSLAKNPERLSQIKGELEARVTGKTEARKLLRGLDKKVGDMVRLDDQRIGRVTWVREDGKMLKVAVEEGERVVGVRRVEPVSIHREAAMSLEELGLLEKIKWKTVSKETIGGEKEVITREIYDTGPEGERIPTGVYETVKEHVGGRTYATEMRGEVMGLKVTVRRITNGSSNSKNHTFEVDYADPKGNTVTIKSETQWKREIFDGQAKATDASYLNRRSIKSTTKSGALKESEQFVRDIYAEEALEYAEFNRNVESIDLFPEDAPRNIWNLLSEGVIPKELRDALPFLDETVLQEWAKGRVAEAEAAGTPPDLGAENILKRIGQRSQHNNPDAVTDEAVDIFLGDDVPRLDEVMRTLGSFRLGWNDRLQTDEVPIVADLAQQIFGHTLAVRDTLGRHVPSGPAATTPHGGGLLQRREPLSNSLMFKWSKTHTEARDAYVSESPRRMWERTKAKEDFETDVKRQLDARDPEMRELLGIDPKDYLPANPKQAKEVLKAADAQDAFTKQMLDYVQGKYPEHPHEGVPEFRNFTWRTGYYTKIKSISRIGLVTGKGGKGDYLAFREHFKKALISANPNMPEPVAQLISRAQAKYMSSPNVDTPHIMDRALGAKGDSAVEMLDSIEHILIEGTRGAEGGPIRFEPSERTALAEYIEKELKLPKGSPRAMRRLRMNMMEKQTYMVDGKPKDVLMSDLFESNLSHVNKRYALELIRRVQDRYLVKRYSTDTYKPADTFMLIQHIKEKINKEMHGLFGDPQREDDLDLILAFFENRPKFVRGGLGKGILIAKQLAMDIRVSAFTFAQAPEATTGTVSTGILPVIRDHIPALQKLIDGVKYGRISKQQTVDLVDEFGYGWAEHDIRRLYDRSDYVGETDVGFNRGIGNKVYGFLSRAQDPLARMGHFYHINVYSDRVVTRNFSNILARISKVGNIKSSGNPILSQTRISQLGAKMPEFNLLINELRKPGVLEFQQIGGKETGTYEINFDKMSLPARNVFRTMQMRNIRSNVQRSNVWDHHYNVITDPAGELLTQFRAFGWTSQSNHFARNIQARDSIAMSNVVTMLFSGMLTHIGLVALRYADDPERRAELLSWENVLKGAMLRAGIFGMWPDFIDASIYPFTGVAPISPTETPMLTAPAAFSALGDVRESITGIMSGDWAKVNRINPYTKMWWFELAAGTYKSMK